MRKRISISIIILGLIMGGYGLSQSFERNNTVSAEQTDIAIRSKSQRNKAALLMGIGLILIFSGVYIEIRRSGKPV